MKESRDNERIEFKEPPAELLTASAVIKYMAAFPQGDLRGLDNHIFMLYKEGQMSNFRDEYGRGEGSVIRVAITMDRRSFIPENEREARKAPTCAEPIEADCFPDNPDFYICNSCKRVHHRHGALDPQPGV